MLTTLANSRRSRVYVCPRMQSIFKWYRNQKHCPVTQTQIRVEESIVKHCTRHLLDRCQAWQETLTARDLIETFGTQAMGREEVVDPSDMVLRLRYYSGLDLYDFHVQNGSPHGAALYDTRPVFLDMASALGQCHHHGIVHGDIKPENFVFETEARDRLQLVDFGMSSMPGPRNEDSKCTLDAQYFGGTPAYMAPELDGVAMPCSPAADVWSLGVAFHCILFGQHPRHANDRRSVNLSKFDKQLVSLVKDMLSPHHADRPCVEEVVDRLRGEPLPPHTSSHIAQAPAPRAHLAWHSAL